MAHLARPRRHFQDKGTHHDLLRHFHRSEFALSVAGIFSAHLNTPANLLDYFVFTMMIQIVSFVLIGIHVILSERSVARLDGLINWLKNHPKPLAIGLFTILGLIFLINGVMGLTG